MVSQPQEIAPCVFYIEVGKGVTRSNVYFVRSGVSWVLIDTGSAHCGPLIQAAADQLFGANTRPAAIFLTHAHPDHSGSALELARKWGCLAYVHPDELPYAVADSTNFFNTYRNFTTSSGRWTPPPLDKWFILPVVRAIPKRKRAALLEASSLKDVVVVFEPGKSLPGLPDWECLPTPGHTPGHAAFFRPADRVLISGDALVTVNLNSLWQFLLWGLSRNKQEVSVPPWFTTWNWEVAKRSVACIARLNPGVVAGGHGKPMTGPTTPDALQALAAHLS